MKKLKVKPNGIALVDDEDYERLKGYSWWLSGWGYAGYRLTGGKTMYLHKSIIPVPKGMEIDHINGNKLDNRKQNLRVCTRSQNVANTVKPKHGTTSQYKGVFWNKLNQNWNVQITVKRKRIHIGCFKEERHAAIAADLWAKDLFGEYARLNFQSL